MNRRDLPSVEEVLQVLNGAFPHRLAVSETRRAIDEARRAIEAGSPVPADIAAVIRERLAAWRRPSLRRVINATGVVLHTNLGRAPLCSSAAEGYANLEYDLASGKRGKRDVHIAPLLLEILGAPGIAVNNNAAAVFLALNEIASGGEVIVSRGELIEIGDGFRIPDIMARSGAILREVGTTNRTSVEDYRDAIGDRTRLILRVHPSNFRIEGFASRPEAAALAALARERGIPLYEDLGSGCFADLRPFGINEPLVTESLRAGVDVVSFSCDKLLGGPQAGILAGREDLIGRMRRNPMFRAFRLDKMIYQSLEMTLRHVLLEEWDAIPALRMIRQTPELLERRARRIAEFLGAEVVPGRSLAGGGSTPCQDLPAYLIALPASPAFERKLRLGEPPVIARVESGRLLIDLRTVMESEEEALVRAVQLARS